MTARAYNFSAGPATLPLEVLEEVKENIISHKGSGIGVMELSHRSSAFEEIITGAEASLRELLDIPDSYAVMFLTGGASNQFSAVPLNLCGKDQIADYIVTGSWSKKALKEAGRHRTAKSIASSEDKKFSYLPDSFTASKNSAYVHFTSNNTIAGTQFHSEPVVNDAVLICDASSDLLHKKIDVTKYGYIYAGAQKNLGPAGVTIGILRKDLAERAPDSLPVMLDYRTYIESDSLYNTPPTFPIYVVGEVFNWLKKIGGLEEIEKRNQEKAAILYETIDSLPLFKALAERDCRSLMNVTFELKKEDLQPTFLEEAAKAGLSQLKGHRSVGGLRASIYNAFPKEGVVALAEFMKEFQIKHG